MALLSKKHIRTGRDTHNLTRFSCSFSGKKFVVKAYLKLDCMTRVKKSRMRIHQIKGEHFLNHEDMETLKKNFALLFLNGKRNPALS